MHSNASIRKLLEKEAKQHLEGKELTMLISPNTIIPIEHKSIYKPKFVENKEYFLKRGVVDPSNLPYLHRNPAV